MVSGSERLPASRRKASASATGGRDPVASSSLRSALRLGVALQAEPGSLRRGRERQIRHGERASGAIAGCEVASRAVDRCVVEAGRCAVAAVTRMVPGTCTAARLGVDVRRGRREGGMTELVAIPPSEWHRGRRCRGARDIDTERSVFGVGGVFRLRVHSRSSPAAKSSCGFLSAGAVLCACGTGSTTGSVTRLQSGSLPVRDAHDASPPAAAHRWHGRGGNWRSRRGSGAGPTPQRGCSAGADQAGVSGVLVRSVVASQCNRPRRGPVVLAAPAAETAPARSPPGSQRSERPSRRSEEDVNRTPWLLHRRGDSSATLRIRGSGSDPNQRVPGDDWSIARCGSRCRPAGGSLARNGLSLLATA